MLYLLILAGMGSYQVAGERALTAGSGQSGPRSAGPKTGSTERRPGNQVSILGPGAGPDLDAFRAVLRPFIQETGVTVSLEATPDVASVLAARIEEGVPPDIAILPGSSLLQRYARAGYLVPLRRVLDLEQMRAQYPEAWLSLGSVQGELYGIFCRAANQSIVWYDPSEFQRRNWLVPATWNEMMRLADRIANAGLTPWSIGLRGPAGSVTPGVEWIENIILRSGGPETYDRWLRHEIPWTDPAVREAFLRWGQIVGRPHYLRDGPRGALQTSGADAADALYRDIPEAYLAMGSSALQPLIARRHSDQKGGRDYDFFPLPPMDPQDDVPVLGTADVVVMFNGTPQAAALMRHLAGEKAQAIWVQRGGFIAPSRRVALKEYPDSLSRRAARQLLEARVLRLDACEQMPPEVEEAFHDAVREFVANPRQLEAILAGVEKVAQEAYAQPGITDDLVGWPPATAEPSPTMVPPPTVEVLVQHTEDSVDAADPGLWAPTEVPQ